MTDVRGRVPASIGDDVTADELRLGDVVQLSAFDCYGDATVKQITEKEVTFFRPYVATDNFKYTGGVICYIGIEEFSVPISDHKQRNYNRTWKLLRRGEVK